MANDAGDGTIVRLVRDNLAYCQFWTELCVCDRTLAWRDQTLHLISGRPTQKLSHDGDEEIHTEYVLPVEMSQYKKGYVTLECLDKVFCQMCPPSASRLTLAIVSNDGTVAFYYVYKGLHKPKRN
ncbi:hypothetical protein HG536_0G00610 [Torulaspora globosa]|uniref:tRNA-splicing endonuclease subunit Sen15 domain-containing protein n=1 Tax=Torulaspora globosa TaxID=48254 RepID=A0A7G3ZL18_9SACH|nr:uncharacterized protein HG536_0G00610 [Torulaspora globosa]QLL34204.1 hypothetical protein HG536_0G00610 [Torulaspora globosa]